MSFKDLYLDDASSSKVSSEVLKTYKLLLDKYYANTSANHKLGLSVKKLEEKSRQQILDLFKLKNYKLIFTASASEANNMAIKAFALENADKGRHIIVSEIEHASVYNACKFLEKYFNFKVTYLKVKNDGSIDLDLLKNSLKEDTILVSIMSVNNELGSLIDSKAWTSVVKKYSQAACHVDMVQALGKIDLNFDNVDLASFSAHKINGLNGSGFLLMRDHIKLAPLISGGDQEYGLRGGSSNAAANITLAKTVRLALENKEEKSNKLESVHTYLIEELKKIKEVVINTPLDNCVYNIVNISVIGVESEVMMRALSNENIYVSAGSTCQSDVHKQSRILAAVNKSEEIQKSRIRISFDESINKEDIKRLISTIKEIIKQYAI